MTRLARNGAQSIHRTARKRGAVYAALPPLETCLYALVTVAWALYSFYTVFDYGERLFTAKLASRKGELWLRRFTDLRAENRTYFWWWSHRLTDASHFEPLSDYLLLFAIISVLHHAWLNHLGHALLPHNEYVRAACTCALWLAAQVYCFGAPGPLLVHAAALPVFTIAYTGRLAKCRRDYKVVLCCKCAVWLVALLFVYHTETICSTFRWFAAQNTAMTPHFLMYKGLQLVSFSLTMIGDEQLHLCGNSMLHGTYKLYRYLLYWPYNVLLIVPYEYFEFDFCRRDNKRLPVVSWLYAAVHCALACVALEAARTHVYAFTFWHGDGRMLLDIDSIWFLMALSICVGMIFQLFNHLHFAVPGLVASLDGMVTPAPPACVLRVACYSNMWRHFDRGLYNFIVKHVYAEVKLAVAECTSSPVVASAAGTIASFALVAAWHSETRTWVALGLCAVAIERLAAAVWTALDVGARGWRIGAVCGRRIAAALHAVLFFYSGFYSLTYLLATGGVQSAYTRLTLRLFAEPASLLKVWLVLYCFAQNAIEWEMRLGFRTTLLDNAQ